MATRKKEFETVLDWCRAFRGSDADLAALHAAGDSKGLVTAITYYVGGCATRLLVRRGLKLTADLKDELVAIAISHIVEAASAMIGEPMNGGPHIRRTFALVAIRNMGAHLDELALFGPRSDTRRKRRAAARKGVKGRPRLDHREADMPPVAGDFIPWDGYWHNERWNRVSGEFDGMSDAKVELTADRRSDVLWSYVVAVKEAALRIAKGKTLTAIQALLAGETKSIAAAARLVGTPERTLRDQVRELGRPITAELDDHDDWEVEAPIDATANTEKLAAGSVIIPNAVGGGGFIHRPQYLSLPRQRWQRICHRSRRKGRMPNWRRKSSHPMRS